MPGTKNRGPVFAVICLDDFRVSKWELNRILTIERENWWE